MKISLVRHILFIGQWSHSNRLQETQSALSWVWLDLFSYWAADMDEGILTSMIPCQNGKQHAPVPSAQPEFLIRGEMKIALKLSKRNASIVWRNGAYQRIILSYPPPTPQIAGNRHSQAQQVSFRKYIVSAFGWNINLIYDQICTFHDEYCACLNVIWKLKTPSLSSFPGCGRHWSSQTCIFLPYFSFFFSFLSFSIFLTIFFLFSEKLKRSPVIHLRRLGRVTPTIW